MIEGQMLSLALTAAGIGFFHTMVGPDHYLPFIVLSKARNWSMTKTLSVTVLCGIGHVIGSIGLGFLGIMLGLGLHKLEAYESLRGDYAAWGLFIFGIIYLLWGIYRAIKNKHRHHHHGHADGHGGKLSWKSTMTLTPWVLFIIFVLGPCEPLIPLLMFPASKASMGGVILVSTVFAVATIVTMTVITFFLSKGVKKLPMGTLEKYTHAFAGGAISLSAAAILFLGL